MILLIASFTSAIKYDMVSAGTDLSNDGIVEFSLKIGYTEYLEEFSNIPVPRNEIAVPFFDDYTIEGMISEVVKDFEGTGEKVITTEDAGSISVGLNIPESGLYRIRVTYYPLKGSGSAIVRKIMVDNEIPFAEAETIEFARIWVDDSDYSTDKLGNDNMPMQIESPRFETVMVSDHTGSSEEPLQFYFSKGEHTITLESVREPMAISAIELVPMSKLESYKTVTAEYQEKGYELSGSFEFPQNAMSKA